MTDSVNYDAEILYNDKRIERLDKLLSELGQHDSTLFVFLSDHGEAWQEHDQFEHRKTLYQEEVHVPWILRWPNGLPSGVTLDSPVGLVDVSPTLVGLLGVTPPSAWQGRDLSTWMQGERSTAPRADEPLLLDLVFEHRIEDKIGELAVVKGAFKLILDQFADHSLNPTALYNLEIDPGELHNLLDEPQQARAVEALGAWARSTLSVDRASSQDASSAPMSEAQRRALIELGYIHDEEQN